LALSGAGRTLFSVTDPSSGAPSAADSAAGPVIFVGDKLTEAGSWNDWLPDLDVVNVGRAGDTTTDVLERLDEVIEARPSVVVILIGTNDLSHRASVEQVVRGTEEILFKLRHELPQARLIVQSVLPREQERAEDIHEVNIHLRQFSAAPSVKAEFVDLNALLADERGALRSDYSLDGVGLNEAGYETWLEALRPVLAAEHPFAPTGA
jgi:lysophospholipase L1-like esterase